MSTGRYSRQIRFSGIGPEGQKKIMAGRVAIIGIGALGTVSANALARAGVGFLRLVDRDLVDQSNLQRQVLFTEEDAREARPKAVAAADYLRTVNSEIEIEPVVREVTPRTVEAMIRDMDVVVDGSDNFELRYLLNDACVKLGIPWVYGGALGASGAVLPVVPGTTACLHCYGGAMPPPGTTETCSTAGVLSMTTGVIANVQAIEALKILLGVPVHSRVLMVDLWNNNVTTVTINRNERCPVCALHQYSHLDAPDNARVITLCGNDTVQISPAHGVALPLDRLVERWRQSASDGDGDGDSVGIILRDQVLRLQTVSFTMTLFPDGRALIRGVRDKTAAQAIYNEYVGM